jgi:hypothetical protein
MGADVGWRSCKRGRRFDTVPRQQRRGETLAGVQLLHLKGGFWGISAAGGSFRTELPNM